MKSFNSAYEFVLNQVKGGTKANLFALSLFSGAGIGDLGYLEAGFTFIAHSEKDSKRASLCEDNIPGSVSIAGELRSTTEQLIETYLKINNRPLDLLSITPPCQGMSSSNPSRGKVSEPNTSDDRNILLLDSLPIIEKLRPRIIVVENVPQLLVRIINIDDSSGKLIDIFKNAIDKDYFVYSRVVQMADYGVPQDRKRAVLVAIRKDERSIKFLNENNLLPIPRRTHSKQPQEGKQNWISISQWFKQMNYRQLDSISKKSAKDIHDPLHFVPVYKNNRYLMISDIEKNSGQSAYQNSFCHFCNRLDVPLETAYCPSCQNPMINRPYVNENGKYRLIKGFKSSYRRMHPNRPAPTVTTASSHIGSDYKIHPDQNRVLSVRECADLQTIPRYYNWERAFALRNLYIMRQVIGEALPPWFTYLHGLVLLQLLNAEKLTESDFDAVG